MKRLSVGSKLRIASTLTSGFLLAVGLAAIWLVDHLNAVLEDSNFYNFQMEQVADCRQAMRVEPAKIEQHHARLNDLEKWSRTDAERDLIHKARQQMTTDASMKRSIGVLEDLGTYYRNETAATHQRLMALHRLAITGIVAAMAGGVILFILLGFLIRHWLFRPVCRLRDQAIRLADGAAPSEAPVAVNGTGNEVLQTTAALQKLATQLRDANDRLSVAERLATLGEATTFVAHSLRNQIASIRAVAEAEREAHMDNEAAATAFGHIMLGADKLDESLGDILSNGRAKHAKLVLQPVEPIIHDALAVVRPRLIKKAVESKFEATESLPDIQVDQMLLEQALVAILINAVDASPPLGRIEVRTVANNGAVEICIHDHGEGMTDEVRQKAGTAFFSTKPNAAGLGLAIAQRVAAMHSGRIEIESEPAKGTQVRLCLPVPANHSNGGRNGKPAVAS